MDRGGRLECPPGEGGPDSGLLFLESVDQPQDGSLGLDLQLFRQGGPSQGRFLFRLPQDSIDVQGGRLALKALGSGIIVGNAGLCAKGVDDVLGNQDVASLGGGADPGGGVDHVPIDIVGFHDPGTMVDADLDPDLVGGSFALVFHGQRVLHFDGGVGTVRGLFEGDHETVAKGLDDSSIMSLDNGSEKVVVPLDHETTLDVPMEFKKLGGGDHVGEHDADGALKLLADGLVNLGLLPEEFLEGDFPFLLVILGRFLCFLVGHWESPNPRSALAKPEFSL